MKQLTYRPLKGCRVPVPVEPNSWRSNSGYNSCCHEWQKGAHIDSMPVEAPLDPIPGPRATVLQFKKVKPDQI